MRDMGPGPREEVTKMDETTGSMDDARDGRGMAPGDGPDDDGRGAGARGAEEEPPRDPTVPDPLEPSYDAPVGPFHPWRRDPLPSDDGFISVEMAQRPVPYHIARCFPKGAGDERIPQGQALALSTCRMACMTADFVRGRLPGSMLQRAFAAACLKRLQTMAYLIDNHMATHPELRARLCLLPVIPHWIDGMLISPSAFEVTVHMTIGPEHYWVNLKLRLIGCRWMCTVADIG